MFRWYCGWLASACLLAAGCTSIGPGESVTFQPGVCHRVGDNGDWIITIRAGVYSKSWLNRLEPDLIRIMEAHKLIPDSEEARIFAARLAPFLDDHPRGKVIRLAVAGTVQPLRASNVAGLVEDRLVVSSAQFAQARAEAGPADGWLTFRAVLSAGDQREFIGRAQIVENHGLTVVSDIDDTIKITDVNNTERMLKNTFLLPFQPVPDMAPLYSRWATDEGASFHYLSESPLELHAPLAEFLGNAGYPPGTIELREIDWEGSRIRGFLKIAAAPRAFKLNAIERMIGELPERRYVLVGDSSQHDPEVYGEVARRHPDQVLRIFIRDVTCQPPEDPRYREAFNGLRPDMWRIFREPIEIKGAFPQRADAQ
jgi:hypothetical protein